MESVGLIASGVVVGLALGWFLFSGAREAGEDLTRLQAESRTDPLTGLPNRRAFEETLAQISSTSPTVLALVDLDELKSINDRLGHAAGDQALRSVADVLGRSVRTDDLACRWGGDEFALVLSGATLQDGCRVAERIRAALRDASAALTVSVGIAARQPGDTAWQHSDQALLAAKRQGGDAVAVCDDRGCRVVETCQDRGDRSGAISSSRRR